MPKELILSGDVPFGSFSPVDVITKEVYDGTVIHYRYIDKGEASMIYRLRCTVGERQKLEADWPGIYEDAAEAAVTGFTGIKTKDGKVLEYSSKNVKALPTWIRDQVIDKCKFYENLCGSDSEEKGGQEASPENPTPPSESTSEPT